MSDRTPTRPVSLRPATWRFMIAGLERKSDDELHVWLKGLAYEVRRGSSRPLVIDAVAYRPGAALDALGICDNPALLRGTTISLPGSDVEYVVSHSAAVALAQDDELIVLKRLGDDKALVVTRSRVLEGIRRGPAFDQLE